MEYKRTKTICTGIGILGFGAYASGFGLDLYYQKNYKNQEKIIILESSKLEKDAYEIFLEHLNLLTARYQNKISLDSLSETKSEFNRQIDDISAKIDSLESIPEVRELIKKRIKTKIGCILGIGIGLVGMGGSLVKLVQYKMHDCIINYKKE